jgi:hypothetical protein
MTIYFWNLAEQDINTGNRKMDSTLFVIHAFLTIRLYKSIGDL